MFLKKSQSKKTLPPELRVNTKGIYYYDFWIDSVRYRKSTGTNNLTLAKNILSVRKTDILRGNYSLPSKVRKQFSDVWTIYINKQPAGKTTEGKIDAAKKFMQYFGKKNIKDISKIDIKNYQDIRRKEIENLPKNINKKFTEISYRTVNIELATLSHFFGFCADSGYVTVNPVHGVKKLNELSRIKTLSDENTQKLISGATNKLTRDIILFLIYTGCRRNEALNLKWSDIDFNNSLIYIRNTKNKENRFIPIHTKLKDLLLDIEKIQACSYVFCRSGKKISSFRRSFQTACKSAGIEDLRIHDLRHVFASKIIQSGNSLHIAGKMLGHKTANQTNRYAHLIPDTLSKAASVAFDDK
ncbi:MAG: tyrosine-type recombinase/integrase [bacterium]